MLLHFVGDAVDDSIAIIAEQQRAIVRKSNIDRAIRAALRRETIGICSLATECRQPSAVSEKLWRLNLPLKKLILAADTVDGRVA